MSNDWAHAYVSDEDCIANVLQYGSTCLHTETVLSTLTPEMGVQRMPHWARVFVTRPYLRVATPEALATTDSAPAARDHGSTAVARAGEPIRLRGTA